MTPCYTVALAKNSCVYADLSYSDIYHPKVKSLQPKVATFKEGNPKRTVIYRIPISSSKAIKKKFEPETGLCQRSRIWMTSHHSWLNSGLELQFILNKEESCALKPLIYLDIKRNSKLCQKISIMDGHPDSKQRGMSVESQHHKYSTGNLFHWFQEEYWWFTIWIEVSDVVQIQNLFPLDGRI